MSKASVKHKQNKNEALIFKGLVCLFALAMLFSGYKVVDTAYRLTTEEKAFDELAQIVEGSVIDPETETEESQAAGNDEPQSPEASTSSAVSTGTAVTQPPRFVPAKAMGYKTLKEMNSDFYGWITVPGTKINYPVMDNPGDPEYYMRKGFDKKYSLSGSIFKDYRCSEASGNLILYGHHMKNGVMFGSLPEYENADYYESHKFIEFDTIEDSGTYQVMAAFLSKIYKEGEEGFIYYNYYDLSNPEVFKEYVDAVLEESAIFTGVTAEYGDELLTLSTCNYHTDDGRFVVVALRVK